MSWRFPVLVLAVAVAAFAASRWPQPAAADPPQAKPVDKWEYATLDAERHTWSEAGRTVVASAWRHLAQQLNVTPEPKIDDHNEQHRLAVLNHLGSKGWELVTHAMTPDADRRRGSSVYTFKRRVP
ncbi:MAG: hypothetical protein K2X87_00685 [Gemmataceae bacterium]|nr:hypothetical protein [Gemmataceae bacterium]